MAWYRKYRPQKVSELHSAAVREPLLQVLASGDFSHAYLFAGPRGTGKTSSARILARVLNEPKNRAAILEGRGPLSEPESDEVLMKQIAEGRSTVVIEQDAASHRGIDDIRQLQEQVAVLPAEGLVRVVILDEVHMLTTEAFNALLKLLEEPPERVVFILATTELQKVPITVQSRCQVIRFQRASASEITAVLQGIAQQEKVAVSSDQLLQLVQAAGGSFRDAVKYFEQVVHQGAIAAEQLQRVLGDQQSVDELVRALAARDARAASAFLTQAKEQGTAAPVLEQSLLTRLQQRLHRSIEKGEPSNTVRTIVQLLEHLAKRLGPIEPIEGLNLEIACLSWCLGEGSDSPAPSSPSSPPAKSDSGSSVKSTSRSGHDSPPSAQNQSARPEPAASEPVLVSPVAENLEGEKREVPLQEETVPSVVLAAGNESSSLRVTRHQVENEWVDVLFAVRTRSAAAEALLRQAQVGEVENGCIELVLSLPFHKERLETPKYAHVIAEVLEQRFGLGIQVALRVEQAESASPDVSSVVRQSSDDALVNAVEDALLSMERAQSNETLAVVRAN